MEVKIGVQHAPREVVFDSKADVAEVEAEVRAAVENRGTLALTDAKGRRIVVPGDKIAYVEIGGGVSGQVGFRS